MSPFDKARYARLLKGLEVSEVRLSYALANNDIFRIDSTYFQQQYLAEESVIRIKGGRRLREVGAQIRSFGAYSLNNEVTYLDAGVPFIRGVNMKGGRVNFNDMLYISDEAHSLLWKSEVKKGMVLLSMSGTVGDVAIATKHWEYPVNSNQDIAKIDTAGALNPFTLYAFLLSRFGQNYLKREARGSVQQHVFLSQIEQFEIPVFTAEFDKAIERTVEQSDAQYVEAASCLSSAETNLLHAFGLAHWQPADALSYVRSSAQAFAAERFDAEYFHPAKTEALAKLSALSDCTVGDLFNSVRELWQPDDDSGPDAVRNYDLTEALSPFLDGLKEPSDRTTIASTKKAIRAGDLVVSRLRSYLKEIALVQSGGDVPMVASTEYIVLRPKHPGGFPVEALMIFLRSALPQVVFKWSQDGSNHPRFDEKELLRLPLPRVLIQHANDYVAAVRAVIAKRQRATQLLDAAKRAVEIAIEQDEKSARAYLKAQA